MILIRLRLYGSPEWTTVGFDGELEESAAIALSAVLADDSTLHVQAKREWRDEWEGIADFLFEEEA